MLIHQLFCVHTGTWFAGLVVDTSTVLCPYRNMVRWSEKEGINRLDHEAYLQEFKRSFFDSMVAKIDSAVHREKSLNTDELYIEVRLYKHDFMDL